ncbi:MAG TPA: signal peptidase I [Microlunatus sp.]
MSAAALQGPEATDDLAAIAEENMSDPASGPHPATTRPAHTAGRILIRLGAVVSTIAALAIVALAVGLTVIPAVKGGQTLTVLSGSMVPRLPVGSVVVNKPADPATLHVGDIITYAIGDNLVTHRIVKINQRAGGRVFITKGDANDSVDSRPVRASQIRGQLWYAVPYIGTVRNFVLTKAGLVACGGAVLLIAAIWFLVRINRPHSSAGDSGTS